jgi:hypothetical protein
MDDIIHKPYRTNDLFEKINQLLVLRPKKWNVRVAARYHL